MMKKVFKCFVALLAIAAAATGPARGQSSTSTLTFTGAYGTYGATADDEVEWTVTSDAAESQFQNGKGIHYGTTSAAVGYIELSTSGITGTITQVVVNASTASSVYNATVGVTVGGDAFGGDPQSLSSTATDYTFTGSASGEIVVRVAKPSAATKALYVKSIEVTYTPASSGGGSGSQTLTLWPSDAVVYDFEAAAAAGENPGNKNGSSANGQNFYGWENSGKPDQVRNDYKGYEFSTGSVLPRTCHVWRRSDRINGNVSGNGGLKCPSNKEMAIDSLTAGMMVVIIYDSTAVTTESKQILWAIGDGTAAGGPGHPRATATIGGVEAVPGVTPIRSGDTIIVTSVTPAENGTGYIVFQVKKNMVIKQIAVWEAPQPPAPPQPHTVRFASGNDGWTVQDVTASASATAPAVLQNVMAGDSLVVTAPATLNRKVKSVKAVKYVEPVVPNGPTYTLLSAATAENIGMVVCADGHLHDAQTAVPDGCTAVGILGKVTETGHGLILALQDATDQTWNTINGWTSETTYAGTTLKVLPDDAARGSLTSYTTLGETAVSNWAVAQKSDYDAIFTNLGSTTGDGDGKVYDANVNAYITTGVGGTAISGDYWSATNAYSPWYFHGEYWDGIGQSNSLSVRPVLGF